jgi:hypothetical protein
MLSACGFRCDLCPAFNENVSSEADQVATSEGWKKYNDIDMPPEQISCDGYSSPLRSGHELPSRKCETRDCVTKRGLGNCASCEEYLCDRRESNMRDLERAIEKHASSVSEEEYSRFFEPYDARKHLGMLKRGR